MTSAHFTLWTDAGATRGRELVREMERRRQLVTTAMSHARGEARAFVIALRNSREVGVYLPKEFVATAWTPNNPTGMPGILLPADADDREHAVSHELTHVISFGVIKEQPPWLAEGIATYFEMVDLKAEESSVQIGMPREDRAATLLQSHPLSSARLFACKKPSCQDGLFYATSWALFSFLLFNHYDELGHYLQRLNERSGDRAAWDAAFADLPLDKLDRDLSEWLVNGTIGFPRIEVTVRDIPIQDRPLGDADALAARSLLSLVFNDETTATRTLAEALQLDRTNLLARLIEAEITHTIEADDARAITAAHPDDWRAWRLLAVALKGSPEAYRAIGRACALSGNEAPECAPLRE